MSPSDDHRKRVHDQSKGRGAELRNVVRAWLLFGGTGSRARRGLGSLIVSENASAWLPAEATREAFAALFGRDVFAPTERAAGDTPRLAGAALHAGRAETDAMKARTTARSAKVAPCALTVGVIASSFTATRPLS